jgi:TRAP-type C4-dicarboxylate transport system substrate-binding protein
MLARRHLLSALAVPPILKASRAAAQGVQLRISTAAAEQDWLNGALQRFKASIERELPGQLAVSLHANASLFRQGTEVPALQRGNLEMSTMTTFEVEQQMPQFGAFSAGYGFRDYDHLRRVFTGPIGQEYFAAVAERMGIQIIDVIYLGTRQMNLRQVREVRTPADLAGVKLRMPPGPGWQALAKGLGVTPVSMGIPEVYLALKSGAIDGQENPLNITRVNNFHEVTRQIVLTSHLVQPVFFAFAKPFWDRLSAPQQAVLRREARAAAEFNDSGRITDEREMLGFFESAGLAIARPDLAPFRAAVARQYETDGLAARWAPGLAQRIAETA